MVKKREINLLRGRDKRFVDKAIGWAFTVGRMLVIFTETIALSAFLYRFTLDYRLIDLKDEIKAKQNIVGALKNDEAEYRNLQARIAYAATIEGGKEDIPEVIAEMIRIATGKVIFNTLTVNQGNVRIDANVRTVSNLTRYVNELRRHPQIASVSIDKVENKTSEGVIAVFITAELKKGNPANEN